MTAQPPATDQRQVLERNHAEIVALLATGATQPEVAQQFGVARSTVLRFVRRNQSEIDAKKHRVSLAIEDFAIAKKVNRIRDAQLRRDLLERVRELRAAGGTGMETGIVVRQYKLVGSGENAQMVEEYKVDTAFLAEWRANDRQVAEELAQLPRPEVNVSSGNTYVLQVVKSDDRVPLG